MRHHFATLTRSGVHVVRVGRRLLAIPMIVGALVVGCSDPAAPDARALGGPHVLKEVDGRPQLHTVQLRAIEDPNIIDDPNLRAHGFVQLLVTRLPDGSVRIVWRAQIYNPAHERFTGWSLNDLDNGGPSVRIAFDAVDGLSDRLIDPEDATIVSAEIARQLFGAPGAIEDPNIRVVFHTTRQPLGALTGTL